MTKELKLSEISRYNNVPKLYEEDFGFMVMPYCPEFKEMYTHVVSSTDTISGLARQYYGDSLYQWVILSANELPFPPVIKAGQVIYIPSPDEVAEIMEG